MPEQPDPVEILVTAADRCERECGMTPSEVRHLLLRVLLSSANKWEPLPDDPDLVPRLLRGLADTVEARPEPEQPPTLN